MSKKCIPEIVIVIDMSILLVGLASGVLDSLMIVLTMVTTLL